MKNTLHVVNIKDSVIKGNHETDTIQQCLTDECKDCKGSYINKLFGHRLICLCKCHKLNNKKRCYTAKVNLIPESFHREDETC
jgi:hypothetical protein